MQRMMQLTMKKVAIAAREAMAIRHWLTRPSRRVGEQGRPPPPDGSFSEGKVVMVVVVLVIKMGTFSVFILGIRTPEEELVELSVVEMGGKVVEKVSLVEDEKLVELGPGVEDETMVKLDPEVADETMVELGPGVEDETLVEKGPEMEEGPVVVDTSDVVLSSVMEDQMVELGVVVDKRSDVLDGPWEEDVWLVGWLVVRGDGVVPDEVVIAKGERVGPKLVIMVASEVLAPTVMAPPNSRVLLLFITVWVSTIEEPLFCVTAVLILILLPLSSVSVKF